MRNYLRRFVLARGPSFRPVELANFFAGEEHRRAKFGVGTLKIGHGSADGGISLRPPGYAASKQ
jgi:hypothetical protein